MLACSIFSEPEDIEVVNEILNEVNAINKVTTRMKNEIKNNCLQGKIWNSEKNKRGTGQAVWRIITCWSNGNYDKTSQTTSCLKLH